MKINRLLTFTILAVLWVSCSTNKNENSEAIETVEAITDTTEQIKSLTEITDYLSTKVETFEIDPTKDTTLTFEKGTKIYLSANSLQFKDGSSPSGPVKIEIKECYSLADFIGDNLTTTSGNKILETGGMVHISISRNNKPLSIKKNKEYSLYFPKKDEQKQMSLFYGKRDSTTNQIDWELSPDTYEATPSNKQDSLKECAVLATGYRIPPRGIMLTWIKNGIREDIQLYVRQNMKPSEQMKDDFCGTEKFKVTVKFKLNSKGKISNIEFAENNPTNAYDEIFSKLLLEIPAIDTTYRMRSLKRKAKQNPNDEYYEISFYGKKVFSVEKFEKKYASFKDKPVSEVDKTELNNYIFSANKMGWINCDRFITSSEENINFSVKFKYPNETKILMAFKDLKSFVIGKHEGDRVVFSNVPGNQAIKIIGISYRKGTPTMAIADTITNKNGFELTSFNVFTLDQLKTELNNLN